MNDEELKGMVVNNTAVPLQDGVRLDSLFETPKKDTSEEAVSSSSVSPAELRDPMSVAQDIIDSFNREKEKANATNDSAIPSIDSSFPDLGFQKEEEKTSIPSFEEVSIPEVTIENPNQDDDSETEGTSFDAFSTPIQNNEATFTEDASAFVPANDMNFASSGMDSVQNMDMEIPQVTIENPNQDDDSETGGTSFDAFSTPIQNNEATFTEDASAFVPANDMNFAGNSMDSAQNMDMGIPQVTIEDPNQDLEMNTATAVPTEMSADIPFEGNISVMPMEQEQVFSPTMSEEVNTDVNASGMEQMGEIPMVSIEDENSNDMDTINPDGSFAPIETNMLFDQALQPAAENVDSNMGNQDINGNSIEVAEVVSPVSPQMDIENMGFQTAPIYESVPNMQANPNVEPISINLSGDMNDAEEYQETPSYVMQETVSKTQEEIDLEKRNGSGIRFIIIFGLIVLIFIILLPYISELI